MNPTATTTKDLRAAEELARLLPSAVPLTPRRARPGELPAKDAVAIIAPFVGDRPAELIVVPQQSVAEALAGAGTLSLVEAIRPALEQAATALGAGILGSSDTRAAGDVLGSAEVTVYALEAEGSVQAWFGLRERSGGPAVAAPPLPAGAMRVLYDMEMTLTAEIGRARLPLREVLSLTPGAILELDRSAGGPADVMVNGRLVARGEIVVVDEEYAVRITEIVPADENAG